MALTSFSFLCFVVVTVLVYYILPGRIRWLSLLTASLLFCYLSGGFAVLGFLLYGILVTYLGALLLQRLRQESRFKGFATGGVVCLTLLPLFLLKYIRFFGFETPFGMLAPLGISFYTMTLLGYVIDVSWGTARAQKNPLKHALFACYFPQMVSGPITRYGQMESQLFVKHSFSYEQAAFGAQRILWGFFKKLVISERLAMVVDAVYGWYSAYPGWYLVVATVCFAFQLYTDFSGCMDIVLGVSQILGITLPENFTCPYFSLSISPAEIFSLDFLPGLEQKEIGEEAGKEADPLLKYAGIVVFRGHVARGKLEFYCGLRPSPLVLHCVGGTALPGFQKADGVVSHPDGCV